MEAICLDELKKIELGILVYIDEVCKRNKLTYSLCGGTLLGAIRHKGFIPWDDDIDIMMPRPDYDKFIDIVRQEKGRYQILSPLQEDYYYNFSKMVDTETVLKEHHSQPIANMGVFVDVFPLDGMPSDTVTRDKHFNRLFKLRRRINSFVELKPTIRKNLIAYAKTLYSYRRNKTTTPSKFQRKYEALANQYPYDKAEYVLMSGGAYGKKEMFPKSFTEKYETRVFENREFSIIKEYDSYLTHIYGDYMQLPPKEKQVTHHHFTATYKITDNREENK